MFVGSSRLTVEKSFGSQISCSDATPNSSGDAVEAGEGAAGGAGRPAVRKVSSRQSSNDLPMKSPNVRPKSLSRISSLKKAVSFRGVSGRYNPLGIFDLGGVNPTRVPSGEDDEENGGEEAADMSPRYEEAQPLLRTPVEQEASLPLLWGSDSLAEDVHDRADIDMGERRKTRSVSFMQAYVKRCSEEQAGRAEAALQPMTLKCHGIGHTWADYFNNIKKCWEPLLERCYVTAIYEEVVTILLNRHQISFLCLFAIVPR